MIKYRFFVINMNITKVFYFLDKKKCMHSLFTHEGILLGDPASTLRGRVDFLKQSQNFESQSYYATARERLFQWLSILIYLIMRLFWFKNIFVPALLFNLFPGAKKFFQGAQKNIASQEKSKFFGRLIYTGCAASLLDAM